MHTSIIMNNLTYKTTATLLLSSLLLGACGQFSYKRGAGAAELNQAQQTCQAGVADRATVEQCLEKNGWVVKNLDDFDPVATIMPTTDNRGSIDSAPADKEAPAAPVASSGSATPAASAPAKKPANIMDEFKISSWWKLGGTTAQLNTALDECVAKLGEAHKPDSANQKATRGLLLCMREGGWHGLQAR